jgi:hypothetical protein
MTAVVANNTLYGVRREESKEQRAKTDGGVRHRFLYVGDSGAPFRTAPVKKYLNTRRVRAAVSDTAEVPLVYKRNRQDGVSGAPFRTAPVKKYLNTRRVR